MRLLPFLTLCCLLAATSRADSATDDPKSLAAAAFEAPLCAGLDVSVALTRFLAAEEATDFAEAQAALAGELPALPQTAWKPVAAAVELKALESSALQKTPELLLEVWSYRVDGLLQFALAVRPADGKPRPLLIYLHGAAYGVPRYSIPTLVELARAGYAVAAPALRGEPLIAGLPEGQANKYVCEGKIENLLGEPRDVVGLGLGLLEQPWVSGERYGVVGHSFGAGAGLLAAAQSDRVACVVSYDAWLTNPFRFYWERLRGGSRYYWESWDDYAKQPVAAQLSGLMARSVVHHADRIQAPLLLFVGERDAPGYHRSHEEFAARLKAVGKTFQHTVIPDGSHNFVLYRDSAPARQAAVIEQAFLAKHFPAGKPPQADKQD